MSEKMKQPEKELAEVIERFFKSREGEIYLKLEVVTREKLAARAFSVDIKSPSYDREMAYFKGGIDAINSLYHSRQQYLTALDKERTKKQ